MRLLPLLYKLRIDLSNGNIERSHTPTIHKKGETVYQKRKQEQSLISFYTHKDINLSTNQLIVPLVILPHCPYI